MNNLKEFQWVHRFVSEEVHRYSEQRVYVAFLRAETGFTLAYTPWVYPKVNTLGTLDFTRESSLSGTQLSK